MVHFEKTDEASMIRKTCLIVSMITLLALCSCEDNLSEFEPEPEPGQRNYVWTLDTLDMPMNYISSVWGASPDDVWAVGGGGTQYDRLLHYDGTEWTTYTKETIWCTGMTLFGFSADNVWMGGQAGWGERGAGIWHYGGAEWKQNYVYSIEEDYYSITVEDIWGTSPNDVYACGTIAFDDGKNGIWRGFVMQYDGTNWREIARADFNSQFITVRKEDNKLYILSYAINYENGEHKFEIYVLRDNQLKKIYSEKESIVHGVSLFMLNNKLYFLINRDMFIYNYGKFFKTVTINHQNFVNQICGRSENDLFLWMIDGLAHYNGTDIEYLYTFPGESIIVNSIIMIHDHVLLDKHVFFGGFTRIDGLSIIIRGMLNDYNN